MYPIFIIAFNWKINVEASMPKSVSDIRRNDSRTYSSSWILQGRPSIEHIILSIAINTLIVHISNHITGVIVVITRRPVSEAPLPQSEVHCTSCACGHPYPAPSASQFQPVSKPNPERMSYPYTLPQAM